MADTKKKTAAKKKTAHLKKLVIVESPSKADTIKKYLGSGYEVKASVGHLIDLPRSRMGVNLDTFEPDYIVMRDKSKVMKELRDAAKNASEIILASDPDREGEAIAYHIRNHMNEKVLSKLKNREVPIRRIKFEEITQPAVLDAINHPIEIDNRLVNAQQSRRVIDRLFGYQLSPLLWKKVKSKLSAGRVQSVALRIICEREDEIDKFIPVEYWEIKGHFKSKKHALIGELVKIGGKKAEISDQANADRIEKEILAGKSVIGNITVRQQSRKALPPFITSTLQQAANNTLGYSSIRTMMIAQELYEGINLGKTRTGLITYMRTDSVNLSELALDAAEQEIKKVFGKQYSHKRQYKTKSDTAQEAHEAIRPTDFSKEQVSGTREEKALYELIWKRTTASQMSDAQLERTIAKIKVSNANEQFVAKGEVIKFDGFLKIYFESYDEENGENGNEGVLPNLVEGQKISFNEITATERFTRPPSRYTEASLVKKLEELGIGRPSTYAPTISTIQKRGYVHKEEREGTEREYAVIRLDESKRISAEKKTEITGADKGKLFPNDVAMLVNDFLIEHFPQIMDYQFTAHIEDELDEIATGKIDYHEMLEEFYPPFKEKVQHIIENAARVSGERILGKDPVTGKQVSVRMARFGPVAVLSNPDDKNDTPHYAGLRKTQKLENIIFEEALQLFELPRVVGEHNDREVVAAIGRFGPYLKYDGKFYSIKNQFDPHDIEIDDAIDVIEAKHKADAEKTIKTFEENPEYQILKGRWGPYLKAGKENVRIPKDRDPASLTLEEVIQLAEEAKTKPKRKGRARKS